MQQLECERMFVAVLETGSFAKAAQRQGTSPGQASKLISKLEADLGVRLLNRTTRALAATEAGTAYFERIRALIEDYDNLAEAVKNRSGAARGRLRLTAPMSFGTIQLVPALLDFAAGYPDIDIDVNFSDRVANLVDEGFDAAIRIGKPADTSLIARKLCDARVAIAASPAYLEAHGVPVAPADLMGHVCIFDSNFRDNQWRFRDPRSGEVLLIDVAGRLRFSNADACIAAAERGLGITRVPSFMAGPRFKAGTLKPLLHDFEDRPSGFGVHILYPPGRHLAIKVRVLVDFLVARYRGEPSWDLDWQ